MTDAGTGRESTSEDDAYCRAALRAGDRDRFLASLFAPPSARPHLTALGAFAVDLNAVRTRVSDPSLGEMRLQWWRDAVWGFGRGETVASPVARALARAVSSADLSNEMLEAMIDARLADIHGEEMTSLVALERYLADSEGTLIALGARILDQGGAPRDAVRHAGQARGFATLINDVAARPLCVALLPGDLMDVHGVERTGQAIDITTPQAKGLFADLCATARDHLARARGLLREVSPAVLPAFLPLATVELDIRRFERGRGGPGGALLRRQIAIWRAARRGRI